VSQVVLTVNEHDFDIGVRLRQNRPDNAIEFLDSTLKRNEDGYNSVTTGCSPACESLTIGQSEPALKEDKKSGECCKPANQKKAELEKSCHIPF